MSTDNTDESRKSLEKRLIAGYSRTSDFLSKTNDLLDEAEDLPIEHKKRLPEFTGQWSEDNVESYINELERIIREPKVAQSEDRLKEIGITEEKIDTIKRDILQNYSDIDELASEYEQLVDEFSGYVEFLIEDDILVNQLREEGPVQTRHHIEIDNEAKYQNLTSLDNLPRDLKETFFREVFSDERSVDEVQDLDGWVDTLKGYGVQVAFSEDIPQFIENCETTVSRARTLCNEYGYSDSKVGGWIEDLNVSEAKDELSTRIDQAAKERERLQRELEEYCELMGRDVPDISEVPELEEEVSNLYEDLLNKIGANGERLLEFLLGKSDELPEDQEAEDLLDTLEQIRPLLQRRLERE
jgi:predicted RNase H-like nuclease (RuvC/YqgF family)